MTTTIFRTIIGRLDHELIKNNQNVVLLLDNAPAHDDKLTFGNVKMFFFFLLSNTTAHYQPLDAGIIADFKNHYRMTQYRHALIKYSTLGRNKERILASGSFEAKQKPFFWIDQLQATN